MKYEEFKEIILKIDTKAIELDEIVKETRWLPQKELFNFKLDRLVKHLNSLAKSFEARIDFEKSQFILNKKPDPDKFKENSMNLENKKK